MNNKEIKMDEAVVTHEQVMACIDFIVNNACNNRLSPTDGKILIEKEMKKYDENQLEELLFFFYLYKAFIAGELGEEKEESDNIGLFLFSFKRYFLRLIEQLEYDGEEFYSYILKAFMILVNQVDSLENSNKQYTYEKDLLECSGILGYAVKGSEEFFKQAHSLNCALKYRIDYHENKYQDVIEAYKKDFDSVYPRVGNFPTFSYVLFSYMAMAESFQKKISETTYNYETQSDVLNAIVYLEEAKKLDDYYESDYSHNDLKYAIRRKSEFKKQETANNINSVKTGCLILVGVVVLFGIMSLFN